MHPYATEHYNTIKPITATASSRGQSHGFRNVMGAWKVGDKNRRPTILCIARSGAMQSTMQRQPQTENRSPQLTLEWPEQS